MQRPVGTRDERIDIIRGLSLIGIVLVNVNAMNSPAWMHAQGFAFIVNSWDSFFANTVFDFFAKKTYPIFAFLFGYSASIFLSRQINQHIPVRYWYQRMFALSVFGFLNVLLIWWGDILINYAIVGLLLPLFFIIPKRYLWIVCCFLIILLWLFSAMVGLTTKMEISHTDYQLYLGQLDFYEITKQRLYDFYIYNFWGYFQFSKSLYWFLIYFCFHWQLLTLMVLGMICQKRDVFKYDKFPWLMITLILMVYIFIQSILDSGQQIGFFYLKNLLLPAVLVLVLMFMLRDNHVRKWFSPLAKAGQMSLTIYLISSLIFSLLFYGYGVGLYGKTGPAHSSVMAILLMLFLCWLSVLWGRKFPVGPLEFLLRKITYLS